MELLQTTPHFWVFLRTSSWRRDDVGGPEWNMNLVRLSTVCIRARARREEADQAYALDYNVVSAPDPRLVQENAKALIARIFEPAARMPIEAQVGGS